MQFKPISKKIEESEVIAMVKHPIVPTLHATAVFRTVNSQRVYTTFGGLSWNDTSLAMLDTRPYFEEHSLLRHVKTFGRWNKEIMAAIAGLIVPGGFPWSDRLKSHLVHLSGLVPDTYYQDLSSFEFLETCESCKSFEKAYEMVTIGDLTEAEGMAVKAAIIWRSVVNAFAGHHKLYCEDTARVITPSDKLFHKGYWWWFTFEQEHDPSQLKLQLQ